MEKINTIIIDDDECFIETLAQQLSFFPFISLIGTFNNFFDSKVTLKSSKVNLIFLDVKLKNTNGIEIAESIKDSDKNMNIIFITSQPKYALEGYKVAPFDFLTKPINPARLDKTLFRLKVKIKEEHPYITEDIRIGIKVGTSIELIQINSIKSIEKKLRKIEIHLDNGEEIISGNSLKELERKLHIHGFILISRTLLTPLREIKRLDYNKYEKYYEIILKSDSTKIKISKEKYRSLKEKLKDFNWII
ncbi:LytR/AlgR family response regulator transcription factor [Brochothrix thermosphacta]|uniref:DNA-binding response regulator n=1 Tax=Brochothrix thermosphacta TaxID=2756 RepID=A0A1D2KZP2_BROTH|nr:LytTR family DNA-binding domain-containing protein [Brochothrix thermosphacta]ATF27018.1 DNA-binding response regulator [Brochothrix thermosphacta]ATH86376.1 DNA-binding response regulator [Brochothrix thermosphacta]ODJ63175.1 hypothetical protein BFR36_11710 [Brochothrix thermosphacta]ODJ68130.1 hypothetical protein BFR45_11885 [Brochothrix thermosphacta]ODJ72808.1 hypothetical protein BFR39_12475 [Brochothrix thermosphacta]